MNIQLRQDSSLDVCQIKKQCSAACLASGCTPDCRNHKEPPWKQCCEAMGHIAHADDREQRFNLTNFTNLEWSSVGMVPP